MVLFFFFLYSAPSSGRTRGSRLISTSLSLLLLKICSDCEIKIFFLVSWCFKPSQPQRITSGLKETFITRNVVERTSTAEISPEEQSEKARWSGKFME